MKSNNSIFFLEDLFNILTYWLLFFCISFFFINFRASKGVTVGQFLSGTISYAKDEIGKKVVSLISHIKCDLFVITHCVSPPA